jgi:hypothetical protein
MKSNNEFKCKIEDNSKTGVRCEKQCVECGVAELQVEYEHVQSEVDTNKVNVYTCSCGKNTVVKHRDKGVTPMFIHCIHCGERAISHMYKVPQDLKHHLVAYVPKNKEEWKLYKKYLVNYYKNEKLTNANLNSMLAASQQHVEKGGALLITASELLI